MEHTKQIYDGTSVAKSTRVLFNPQLRKKSEKRECKHLKRGTSVYVLAFYAFFGSTTPLFRITDILYIDNIHPQETKFTPILFN